VSPIFAGMAARKPDLNLKHARVLMEEIKRLQLRACELLKEAQKICDQMNETKKDFELMNNERNSGITGGTKQPCDRQATEV
jgi:hypothetical protein